ncbi:hypothetical protein [uncultured Roseobacter sp.]|uniref:hypothetical protein n=1 Tax=uncultured Roseobacter sp. TaxID=114847 RepID=UPI00262CA471|nr:hypothetical protein [uncultured Roseobacter sp.]
MIKARDFKNPIWNAWQTILIAGFFCWVLVLNDNELAQLVTGSEPPNQLIVDELRFEDGYFLQRVVPSTGESLHASWAANIWQGHDFICGGGSKSTYSASSTPKRFSPDDWTFDDCSRLVEGEIYTASASWVSLDADGHPHTVTGVFDFKFSKAGP